MKIIIALLLAVFLMAVIVPVVVADPGGEPNDMGGWGQMHKANSEGGFNEEVQRMQWNADNMGMPMGQWVKEYKPDFQ